MRNVRVGNMAFTRGGRNAMLPRRHTDVIACWGTGEGEVTSASFELAPVLACVKGRVSFCGVVVDIYMKRLPDTDYHHRY